MLDFLQQNLFAIIILISNIAFLLVIKFNDLDHLRNDFKEFKNAIWKRIDEHTSKLNDIGTNLANLEGRFEERKDK